MAPTHKLDELLNPEKALQFKINQEKALEDIRDVLKDDIQLSKSYTLYQEMMWSKCT